MTTTDPDIHAVARHEAAHAVIFWWWPVRSGGKDEKLRGWVDSTTIVPDTDRPSKHGETKPPVVAFDGSSWRPIIDHLIAGILAGPESDKLRGVAGGSVDDEAKAKTSPAEELTKIGWTQQKIDVVVSETISRIRPQVAVLLQSVEVEAATAAVAAALVEHKTLTDKTLMDIMNGALREL